eukprot:TRINITY_DN2133_c0_g1_i1.p1 TRINITY_DN2133_c0_g1~~TRINITY_DN2133_c0_g1_i1.p1  ORF type:complete len:146 (-),score=46.47 TRINITY_DN2133_c0_g1_i1:175-612(-)
MPFFTHAFEENVFQIIKMKGDPDLQAKIKNRQNNFKVCKEAIIVPQKFSKMVELVQTRRDIWYISEEKWRISLEQHEPGEFTRHPGTLYFYEIPELKSTCMGMIKQMAQHHPELNDQYFLRLQIIEFSDKGDDGTEVSLKISYFP